LKIIYYEVMSWRPASLARLRQRLEVIVLPDPRSDTPGILSRADALLAPLGFNCGREKIDLCPCLKVIGSNTTGEPHIDRAYAESKGIAVVSLMREQEFLARITPTAEHALGLMLAVTRHTPWAFGSVLDGVWNRRLFGGRGMLSAMSLGIVGLGRLGRLLAGYAQAMGMDVAYYDPYVQKPPDSGWSRYTDLGRLAARSDVVSLHVPLNDETLGLISARVLDRFKPGAYLINTARAEVVDEAALLEGLETGRLAGAGLDVLSGEFRPDFKPLEHPLVRYAQEHENLVITPHIGGSTEDAWAMTEERVVDCIIEQLGVDQ